jgi:hypothetical protein
MILGLCMHVNIISEDCDDKIVMVGERRIARIVDSDSEQGRQNSGDGSDDIDQRAIGGGDEDCHLGSVTGDATS